MRVLHITYWYPSIPTPRTAPFIKRQIEALNQYVDNRIWHVEVKKGRLKLSYGNNTDSSQYLIIFLPWQIWRLTEYITFLAVCWVLFKERKYNYQLLNFHIAYPLAANLAWLKKISKAKTVITEHWSAYHFNFNISNPAKLKPIKRIFTTNTPIISVSKSLQADLNKFSGRKLNHYLLPNVVKTNIFCYKEQASYELNFFMVSKWSWPKQPLQAIHAWREVVKRHPEAKLYIGGYGVLWGDMKKQAWEMTAKDQIIFTGYMTPKQIAEKMNQSLAFIHVSDYETFSVVCAEAACCGLPVIASRVGGIPEFINDSNGYLLQKNSKEELIKAIEHVIKTAYNRKQNARIAQQKFSPQKVGYTYFKTLQEILQDEKGH